MLLETRTFVQRSLKVIMKKPGSLTIFKSSLFQQFWYKSPPLLNVLIEIDHNRSEIFFGKGTFGPRLLRKGQFHSEHIPCVNPYWCRFWTDIKHLWHKNVTVKSFLDKSHSWSFWNGQSNYSAAHFDKWQVSADR